MDTFVEAVSYLGPLQSVSAGQRDKNARVLALIHNAVPCRESLLIEGKTVAVPITVLKVLSAGYGIAPFALAKKGSSAPMALRDGEVAEPLFQMVSDIENGNPSSVNMWSYTAKGTITT